MKTEPKQQMKQNLKFSTIAIWSEALLSIDEVNIDYFRFLLGNKLEGTKSQELENQDRDKSAWALLRFRPKFGWVNYNLEGSWGGWWYREGCDRKG